MKKFRKLTAGIILSGALLVGGTIASDAMTLWGYYDISTWTETGIRVWADKYSPYKSCAGKVTEGGRSSGWKKGRDVTATIWNMPFTKSKTYHKFYK